MPLRRSIGGLCFGFALLFSSLRTPLHAQTDKPITTSDATRAIAVYQWTGPLDHPTAARLIPISLFLPSQLDHPLEDAGVYLAQPIPFALQPGTLYLIQSSSETENPSMRPLPFGSQILGAFALQSAAPTPVPNHPLPAWFGYGRFLTPTETLTAITPPAPKAALPPPEPKPTPQPTHKHHNHPKQQAYVTAPTTPILDDPDRPILTANPNPASTSIPELTAPLPDDLHQAIAISDPTNAAPESFAYTFPTPIARNETLQALEALAQPALTHYAVFNHLTPTPNPARTQTTTPTFANAPAPTPTHAQLRAYTLTPTAPPTYILTAESPLTTNGPIYLTLIATLGPSNHPRILLLSLTDATHLDRTPNLIPIDAVDPDATHRADLLFELRSQTTRRFALYDLTTGQPHQTLLTTPIP
ncbi:MAG: hypothetical protein WBY53_00290 [Acidobacteriaceae bacterium]